MKLLAFEIKKLSGARFLRVSLAVLLIAAFALSFYAARDSQKEAVLHKELDAFFNLYFANQAEMDAYYKELTQSAQDPMQQPDAQQAAQKYAPEGYTDLQMFSALYTCIEQAQGYPARMDEVVTSAEKNLAEFRAMGIDGDSYNCKLQAHIIRTYSDLKNTVRIGIEPSRGWAVYFDHGTQNVLLVAMLLLVSVTVASYDRVTDMLPIVHCTKCGKKSVARAKMLTVPVASCSLTLLFSLTSFAAVGLGCGYSSAANAIQSVDGFTYCPYALSIGQYFIVTLLLRTVIFGFFSALMLMLTALIKNRILALGTGIVLWGFQYVLNGIGTLHPDSPLKNLNLITLANAAPLFARLRTCNLLGMVCPYVPLAFVACSVLTVLALALFGIIFIRRQYGNAKRCTAFKLPTVRINLVKTPIFSPNRLFKAELYKMLIASGMLFILLLLGAGKIAAAQYRYHNPQTVSDRVYYEYMTELQGPLTEQALARIQSERDEINGILVSAEQMQEDFIAGEISASDYAAYLEKYEHARSQDAHLARIEQKRDRLLALQGKTGWLLYDTGWLRLLDTRADLLLLLAIALFSAQAFSMEYRRGGASEGFATILRATSKGRRKTYFAKMAAVISVCTVITLMFSFIELLTATYQYALPAARAPLASLIGFESLPDTLTVGGFYTLSTLGKLSFAILLSLCISSLSCLLQRSTHAFSIGAAMIVLCIIPIQAFGIYAAAFVSIPVLLLAIGLCIASYRQYTK